MLRNGFVTFGCLNHFCKVNDTVLTLWAQVMAAVPNSRLMLLAEEGTHRDRTRAASPLVPAPDALILDSTTLPEDEVLRRVEELVQKKISDAG